MAVVDMRRLVLSFAWCRYLDFLFLNISLYCRYCSIALFILVWSVNLARAATGEMLFNLVPQYAPTLTKKVLPIFSDQHFEAGSGCLSSYNLTADGVRASWEELPDQRRALLDLFRHSNDFVTTWWSNPSLCSNASRSKTGPSWVNINVRGPTGVAQSITIAPDRLVMRARSIEQFSKLYGSPFFRSMAGLSDGGFNKLTLYANMRPADEKRIFLSQYSSLILTIDARLDEAHILTGCVPGTPPPGAENCYNPQKMATQFRAAFGNIIWSDPRCRRWEPADPICRYQGRFMQATLSLFDERFEFHDDDFHVQHGDFRRRNNIIPIFRIDLRRLLPAETTSNPFHIIGKRAIARGDILPALKDGLLLGERRGYLPPRLILADGSRETNAEYLSHYSFASMNIGFEVSGLSDMSYSIYKFSLRGLPRR